MDAQRARELREAAKHTGTPLSKWIAVVDELIAHAANQGLSSLNVTKRLEKLRTVQPSRESLESLQFHYEQKGFTAVWYSENGSSQELRISW